MPPTILDQRTGFNSQGNLLLVNEVNADSSAGELNSSSLQSIHATRIAED